MPLPERRLPHLYVIGQPFFVTFRLYASLPKNRPFRSATMTTGQAFVAMDRLLDNARTGPMFLKQPEIAQVVLESLERGAQLGHYTQHAFVIMSNHVHLLLTPHISVPKLLGSLKSATAKRANQLLHRAGQPFWQDESYNHLVRDAAEFRKIRQYIENNPVRAGLATHPEHYRYSSARGAESPAQPERLPHSVL